MKKICLFAMVCMVCCMATSLGRNPNDRSSEYHRTERPNIVIDESLMNEARKSNMLPPADSKPPNSNNQVQEVSSTSSNNTEQVSAPPPPVKQSSKTKTQAPVNHSNISSFIENNPNFTGDRRGSYLTSSGVKFMERMKSCSPAKYAATNEVIYGKTKNGKCHYSYKRPVGDEYVVYHCMLPMRVSLAYATTALDAREYSEDYSDLANERAQQNAEIKKIMQDYCVAK